MRIALIDPFAGISGDMTVGALLHAGAPFAALSRGLKSLPLKGFTVASSLVTRCGIAARKFHVRQREDHHHRRLPTILRLIAKGKLSKQTRERASAAFRLLGKAESVIHGAAADHLHEVGAIDSICDIVGAALALEQLGIERVYCRPLPLSIGSVDTAHGRLPLPAPATMELLKGRPTFESGLSGELITPTGAAIVAAWAEAGAAPPFVPEAIGYGAGERDPDGYPNVCRITVGSASQGGPGALFELVCDVDDATPQLLGHLLGRLLDRGALDATLQPLVMKKDRPGTRVTALVPAPLVPVIEEVLFTEGTTLGVRRRVVERTELPRRIVRVKTRYGVVPVKVGELGGRVVHVAPEYEACRSLAREAGVPLPAILRDAVAQWGR